MVSIRNRTFDHYATENGAQVSVDYMEVYCLSTDEKPVVRIANGSMLIEEDTRKIYLFDEENSAWRYFGGG